MKRRAVAIAVCVCVPGFLGPAFPPEGRTAQPNSSVVQPGAPGSSSLDATDASSEPGPAPERDRGVDTNRPETPHERDGDQSATRLALAAHAQAAAIEDLPRFYYRVGTRHGNADTVHRAGDEMIASLKRALDAPALEKDWMNAESVFAWDEQRFFYSSRLPKHRAEMQLVLTAGESWQRDQFADNPASVAYESAPRGFWEKPIFFEYSYLRVTPRQFRWGDTRLPGNSHCVSPVSPEKAQYSHLGVEPFGGELCDVVESAQRGERLWISRKSGRLRGVLAYFMGFLNKAGPAHELDAVKRIAGRTFASPSEYRHWFDKEASPEQRGRVTGAFYERCFAAGTQNPIELIRFDDYREIKPGVWLPFRETRSYTHPVAKPGDGKICRRSELTVKELRLDRDLTETIASFLPKEGEQVYDRRFAVPVRYAHRAGRTKAEILKLVAAEQQKILASEQRLKQASAPFEALVGKPAPELPDEGWIGGKAPDLAGRPCLLHFWATWCAPCKQDLPLLQKLADQGAIIIGMHPSGTPADEVEKFIRDEELAYPTFLAPGGAGGADNAKIAGYPAGLFPYCIVIDARGQVAGHGSLKDVLKKHGLDLLIATREDDN